MISYAKSMLKMNKKLTNHKITTWINIDNKDN